MIQQCQQQNHNSCQGLHTEILKKEKAEDIMIIAGGVIPQQDYEFLYKHGVAAIFGPGTVIPIAADKILDILAKKVG